MHPNHYQRIRLRTTRILLILSLLGWSVKAAEPEFPGPQAFEQLTVGKTTYHRVKVRKVTPDAITIFHSKGLSQISLADLPLELQEAYNYHPEKSEAYLQEQHQLSLEQQQARADRLRAMEAKKQANRNVSDLQQILNNPLELQESSDLRPRIRELSLISKNQGLRPSCAVFAVVSALEIQNARSNKRAAQLSEEYLIWATRKTLGLDKMALRVNEDSSAVDAGFALMEVVSALRTYGIPKQDEMPNTFGKGMEAIEPPPEEIIQNERDRSKIVAYSIAARDPATSLEYILKILNAQQPVVVGIGWPPWRNLRGDHFLSKQKPLEGYAHAVTLVGYKCETGQLEDVRFIFKNSYGVNWGLAGYGLMTYEYLFRNLGSAIYLDSVSI
ncbi:MAG: C1 family peptidase [Verrucomicrobiae bacterium]|nr:C1 family peptidase [Verrucomicrobiae bacterium]